jgi:cysteine dioxygenase
VVPFDPARYRDSVSAVAPAVSRLLAALSSGLGPRDLAARLRDDPPSRDDLAAWIRDDHPADEDYARTLVAHGPTFEVLVMTWRPGDRSAVHDHGRAAFGAVRVYGPARHHVHHLDGERLLAGPVDDLVDGDVLSVPSDLVHQLENPGPDRLVSLHVYVAEASERAPSAGARLYDADGGVVYETDGGAFRHPPPDARRIGRISSS